MLYPFTFKPIFKEIIWGGSDILPFKGYPEDTRKIGESWELSHLEHNFSVVANGALAGKTIDELINEYGAQLLGAKVIKQYSHTFPLLVKFIDASDYLSVQVHPDDQLAHERHHSWGKTEMWYVVNAMPGACLYSGFSHQTDAADYVRRVENDSIMDILQKYDVKTGDVFFLPAGRVHAIGPGCLIAEIQQTSDITYRIYDYNRQDENGFERELHTGLARDAIDYTVYPDYKTNYQAIENEATELVRCPYFTTNLLNLTRSIVRDYSSIDSFVIFICTQGKAVLNDNNGHSLAIRQGQTTLLPADTQFVTIEPLQPTVILETYL